MAADLTRSLAGGAPWLLMEHSTSAVNWQPRNLAKRPGEMRRNSLAHVARGADSVLFFQWRASRRGAEKFHSAMLPHGGTDTRVWREVVGLGADLAALAPLRGHPRRGRCRHGLGLAVLVGAGAGVAALGRPVASGSGSTRTTRRLWHAHLTVDFVHPGGRPEPATRSWWCRAST